MIVDQVSFSLEKEMYLLFLGEREDYFSQLNPKKVRNINLKFSISPINEPLNLTIEIIKIPISKVKFNTNYISLNFELNDLQKIDMNMTILSLTLISHNHEGDWRFRKQIYFLNEIIQLDDIPEFLEARQLEIQLKNDENRKKIEEKKPQIRETSRSLKSRKKNKCLNCDLNNYLKFRKKTLQEFRNLKLNEQQLSDVSLRLIILMKYINHSWNTAFETEISSLLKENNVKVEVPKI